MNLPINGRIAIIDDQFEQAKPLIQILSQKQLPHTYFSGEVKFLPNEGENLNDIRVLFLDINLIDDREHENKVLIAKLVPVINRVISKENYPYIIVYWSRHEHHKNLIEEEIFNDERVLKHKKPIGYLSATKSDFFNFDGTQTGDFNHQIDELFDKINELIQNFPAYSYLLNWENQVHKATDQTLQDVFSSYHKFSSWSDNANFLLDKLGNSYAGNYFKSSTPEEKIKFAFQAFNSTLLDTVEALTEKAEIETVAILSYDLEKVETNTLFSINKKLLIAEDTIKFNYPGVIIEHTDTTKASEKPFNEILSKTISSFKIREEIKELDKSISEVELKKQFDKKCKEIRDLIRTDWLKIACFVTPLCDFVQKNNHIFDRVVSGIIVSSDKRQHIDDKHEAIFLSPDFEFNGKIYFLILDYRYFHTSQYIQNESLKPIFRLKQQLLSEVQSKLARHISRQGVLFLDSR